MRIGDLPFGLTDWSRLEPTVHAGETGHASSRTRQFGDVRRFTLTPGQMYQVADGAEAHRSATRGGAKLYIVD